MRTKTFTFATILILLSGCNGDSDPTFLSEPTKMQRLNVPFREHGYSNLNHLILTDRQSYAEFIDKVKAQTDWNQKEVFLETLANSELDFTQDNLMLYRTTETSGSNELTPLPPSYENGVATIKINRSVPETGTGDMAYYALVYTVAKDVKTLRFLKGEELQIFSNQAKVPLVPLNCTSWFDGCNNCFASDGILNGCTEKYCEIYEQARCFDWQE